MNDEPKPAPLHPVDVAIITDWLMPDDDEPMTWDANDNKHFMAVDQYGGLDEWDGVIPEPSESNDEDDETDITWEEYRTTQTDKPKYFSERDMAWLQSHSPTPVLMALDLDLLMADDDCMDAAGEKLIELGQYWSYRKEMVKTLFDLGYWWAADAEGDAWVKS